VFSLISSEEGDVLYKEEKLDMPFANGEDSCLAAEGGEALTSLGDTRGNHHSLRGGRGSLDPKSSHSFSFGKIKVPK